jgi:hypothetical protein
METFESAISSMLPRLTSVSLLEGGYNVDALAEWKSI